MLELRRNTLPVDWTLENGSYQLFTNGQIGDFGYKSFTTLVPKGTQNQISRQVGRQFMRLMMRNVALLNNFSMEVGDVPCAVIPSILAPKHCVVIDSCNHDKHGTLIPSVTSFGLKQEFEALFIHKKLLAILLNFSEVFYKSKHSLNVDLQFLVQFNVYDLHQAHPQIYFTKRIASCRSRVCPTERTLLRWRAQELEERAGGPVRRYKGVRWRPQRKHPWVAEIKLPKKRKMWIGDFDTAEAAARAYDSAAIAHGKVETALNFGGESTSNSSSTSHHELSSTILPSPQSRGTLTEHRTESRSHPANLHMSYNCSPLDNYNVACFGSQTKLLEGFTSHISGNISASPNEENHQDRSIRTHVHDNWYSINDPSDFIPLDRLMLEGDQESPFFDTIWGDRSMISPRTKCANNFCSTSMGPKNSSFGTALQLSVVPSFDIMSVYAFSSTSPNGSTSRRSLAKN